MAPLRKRSPNHYQPAISYASGFTLESPSGFTAGSLDGYYRDKMVYKVLIEWDDDSRLWVTRVPELNDLSTFGATEEEALQMTKDAILGYLEAVKQVGEPETGSNSRILELTV